MGGFDHPLTSQSRHGSSLTSYSGRLCTHCLGGVHAHRAHTLEPDGLNQWLEPKWLRGSPSLSLSRFRSLLLSETKMGRFRADVVSDHAELCESEEEDLLYKLLICKHFTSEETTRDGAAIRTLRHFPTSGWHVGTRTLDPQLRFTVIFVLITMISTGQTTTTGVSQCLFAVFAVAYGLSRSSAWPDWSRSCIRKAQTHTLSSLGSAPETTLRPEREHPWAEKKQNYGKRGRRKV